MSSDSELTREVTDVLGYLLKHAHLQLTAATTKALEPFGIDSRALGVLRVLVSRASTSQQEVAMLLGVDRTTMVALLDSLETKGIIVRHPLPHDRRRNVIELTDTGRAFFERAQHAERNAENIYIACLSPQGQQQLRDALHSIVTQGAASDA